MGCDWYNFISISGVGFTISHDQYEIYKNCLGPAYGCFIYSDPKCDYVRTQLFIYDKETITYDETSVPGPYEIDREDNSTQIVNHAHMVKFFNDSIDAMKTHFDLQDDRCSYWSLLTTIRIGEFEPYILKEDGYTRVFSSVDEYRDYHGFSEEELDEKKDSDEESSEEED
jgi:hypothetical protein